MMERQRREKCKWRTDIMDYGAKIQRGSGKVEWRNRFCNGSYRTRQCAKPDSWTAWEEASRGVPLALWNFHARIRNYLQVSWKLETLLQDWPFWQIVTNQLKCKGRDTLTLLLLLGWVGGIRDRLSEAKHWVSSTVVSAERTPWHSAMCHNFLQVASGEAEWWYGTQCPVGLVAPLV